MQHQGHTNHAGIKQTITLPRPDGNDWTFTLQPLPLGFHRRLRDRGVIPPTAPVRIARDSHGRPLRDDTGLAVTQADLTDAHYLADLELYHQRIAVLAVAESLQADPHVRFDIPAPQPSEGGPAKPGNGVAGSTWPAYADALHSELESAGFTAGDLILLCSHIGRLSNLLGDHLHQALANFSSPRTVASP